MTFLPGHPSKKKKKSDFTPGTSMD